jgi:hypothetical protein
LVKSVENENVFGRSESTGWPNAEIRRREMGALPAMKCLVGIPAKAPSAEVIPSKKVPIRHLWIVEA